MIHGGLFVMMLFNLLKPLLPVKHLDTLDRCATLARLDWAKELVGYLHES